MRNWNRLSELTKKGTRMTKADKAEVSYRSTVQNIYAITGKLPEAFIPVGDLNY